MPNIIRSLIEYHDLDPLDIPLFLDILAMSTKTVVGVSLPTEMVARIDGERGDVSRSRFLQRLVEQAYAQKEKKGGMQSV